MTTRRAILGGLAGILAAGFAPAAIGSGVLMPIRAIILPPSLIDLDKMKAQAIVSMTDELLESWEFFEVNLVEIPMNEDCRIDWRRARQA